jgi:hypothetical protein
MQDLVNEDTSANRLRPRPVSRVEPDNIPIGNPSYHGRHCGVPEGVGGWLRTALEMDDAPVQGVRGHPKPAGGERSRIGIPGCPRDAPARCVPEDLSVEQDGSVCARRPLQQRSRPLCETDRQPQVTTKCCSTSCYAKMVTTDCTPAGAG